MALQELRLANLCQFGLNAHPAAGIIEPSRRCANIRWAASQPEVTVPSIQPYQPLERSPPANTIGGGMSARACSPATCPGAQLSHVPLA